MRFKHSSSAESKCSKCRPPTSAARSSVSNSESSSPIYNFHYRIYTIAKSLPESRLHCVAGRTGCQDFFLQELRRVKYSTIWLICIYCGGSDIAIHADLRAVQSGEQHVLAQFQRSEFGLVHLKGLSSMMWFPECLNCIGVDELCIVPRQATSLHWSQSKVLTFQQTSMIQLIVSVWIICSLHHYFQCMNCSKAFKASKPRTCVVTSDHCFLQAAWQAQFSVSCLPAASPSHKAHSTSGDLSLPGPSTLQNGTLSCMWQNQCNIRESLAQPSESQSVSF